MLGLLFLGLTTCSIIMLSAWVWYLITKNPAIIDFNWVLGLGILPIIYVYFGDFYPSISQSIIIGMVLLWAIRLGPYLLFTRVLTKTNDTRYLKIWEKLKWPMSIKLLIQVLLQVFFQWMVSFAYLIPLSKELEISWPIITLGFTIFLFGFLIEAIADHQLFYFKKKTSNKGGICDSGIWQFSRHPNLFGEWLIWIGISITGIQLELFWLAILSPCLMWIIMRKMTIPVTERISLESRKNYKEYQKKVPFIFFPGVKKD